MTERDREEVRSRLGFALEAAHAGGERTLRHFDRPGLRVETKGDGSVVTEADREAERFLRHEIEGAFPDDAILGEEFGDRPGTSGYRWILDPIDGTVSFVRGVPLYGTLIAVERELRSLAGVIRMPALDETVYAGRGMGAWRRKGGGAPVRARVSGVLRASEGMMCTTSFDAFGRAGREALWLRLAGAFGSTRGWSDCYAHVLLATGRIEAVVEPSIRAWDIAPVSVIVEEAGGRCTDWRGVATSHSAEALVTNGLVHDEVLRLLGGCGQRPRGMSREGA